MSQRKNEFKQAPVTDKKASVTKTALLAEGEHRLYDCSSWLIHENALLYYHWGKLSILYLENGKVCPWKGAPESWMLAGKLDPALSRVVLFNNDSFLDTDSINEFPVKFSKEKVWALDSNHLVCTSKISEDKTEIYIFDKSPHFKKHVLHGEIYYMQAFCEGENKFKLFFVVHRKASNGHSTTESRLHSLSLDVNKGIISTDPVVELEMPDTISIEGCQISPDGQNIKIHYYSRDYTRHIQIRKLDENGKIAEPLLDFVVSHTKNRLCPYSSDGSFYYLSGKKIYRYFEGNSTFIGEFEIDCSLDVTADDRLLAMTGDTYRFFSTPCYELNCKIKSILGTVLPRLQMPDTGPAKALADTKDPWSIILGYSGFFQSAPLHSVNNETARDLLKTAIIAVMSQLSKAAPEWSLFAALVKELDNPSHSIQSCAEKIAVKIIQPGSRKPVYSFIQFLKDACIAFPDGIKDKAESSLSFT
ncbi:MAG: hypothetical protein ACYCQI_06755 [Gammaproteobacteria bacterium]